MSSAKPGEWMSNAPYIVDMDFSRFRMKVSTDRYHCDAYQAREREELWMRVWQIAGRADDIPTPGDWMEYRLFDQSWLLVRGRDGLIRGFVNACRHRGNRLCTGKGHSARFNCTYHNWCYGLEGQLVAVAKPDFEGSVEDFIGSDKQDMGLLRTPVECFAGFIFLNPDPDAEPLAEFLGDAADALAAYRIEEMVPVGINVRERIDCNWKVILDAFGEGYHTQGVHPELVGMVDLSKERFHSYGDHGVSTVPFGEADLDSLPPEEAVARFLAIPTTHFSGFKAVLPQFSAMVERYRAADGKLTLPHDVTPRQLLQEAARIAHTEAGLDVAGLTDRQMIDYQFWLLFPNVFMQICTGEATIIIADPDPDNDPHRCYWRVMTLQWLKPEERAANRTEFTEIPEGEHFPYFLALEQDYRQMPLQQKGLRNRSLTELVLTRQEPRLAHFHSALDQWIGQAPLAPASGS